MEAFVWKWSANDEELDEGGFLLADSEEKALETAKKIACADYVEVEPFMSEDDLMQLVVVGHNRTYVEDDM
jgi:hypothetical protein